MAKSALPKVHRYSMYFKATAVRLTEFIVRVLILSGSTVVKSAVPRMEMKFVIKHYLPAFKRNLQPFLFAYLPT